MNQPLEISNAALSQGPTFECLRRISAQTLLLAMFATAHAANWPQWRGPNGDGISVETNVPVKWSVSENIGWKTPIPGEGHSSPVVWGDSFQSYTPLLYRDLLILDCRQESEAALLAFDKTTGKVRWRVEPSKPRISHITPLLVNDGRRQQLIVSGSNETRSVNPDTGETWWWCRGPSDVAVAGMSYGDGLVFVTAGYPDRVRMGVRVDGNGDVTETHVAWKFRRQVPYVPSPVYHAGHFYSVLDEGMLCCFNAKTGDTVWDQRLEGRFRSSLVLAGENCYATNDKGVTTVFRATPRGFESVSVNELQEFCYATPAIADGRLYLRTGKSLFCIGQKRAKPTYG